MKLRQKLCNQYRSEFYGKFADAVAVEGQVLLDYNMDHTIYFPTLNEYRYSPAIAVGAGVGTPVLAVANGKVVSVVNNEETGLTMTVDLGNGYQAVYGQLKETAFEPESYMEAGATLGYVSERRSTTAKKVLIYILQ